MQRLKVREEVEWFAGEMEKTLKKNDHKGHWRYATLQYLSMRLTLEKKELTKAFKSKNSKEIIKECTDVANFAMMIADNLRS